MESQLGSGIVPIEGEAEVGSKISPVGGDPNGSAYGGPNMLPKPFPGKEMAGEVDRFVRGDASTHVDEESVSRIDSSGEAMEVGGAIR